MIEIRPATSVEEIRRAFVIWHYFGAEPTEEEAERFSKLLGDRMLAAWDGDEIVGGAGAFPFELSVPGGRRVAAGGVTVVGVLPTYRRRGILRRLMRAQLDDLHERGEPVAYLWASEATIYGRFGYGMAALQGGFELARERTVFAQPAEPYGSIRLVDLEEALETFPGIYDRALEQRPGMFTRSRDWWEIRALADNPARRGSAGPLNRVLLEGADGPEGYALYRIEQSFDSFTSTGTTWVIEALGVNGEATRALWRWLLDMDWTATIAGERLPIDHPLIHLLAEPRRLRYRPLDSLWVRLVDVGAALSGRGYLGREEVVLEVADEFCPWNEGRWRVGPEGAERTEAAAGLHLDAPALGSVYLGGFTFRQLADALRVAELEPGAIARADELFRTERAPWCVEIF